MILARIPEQFVHLVKSGELQRIGMTLREVSSGQIVGHLQETSATRGALNMMAGAGGLATSGPLAPVNAMAAVVNVVQNQQIKHKIDGLETMMGGLQALQIANLATSVIGIGVTVAGTAMILSRLKALNASMEGLSDQIKRQGWAAEDWDIQLIVSEVEAQIERLEEAEHSKRPDQIIHEAETGLHQAYGRLLTGLSTMADRETFDLDVYAQLLSTASLCAMAQMRSLIWLDEMERVKLRAVNQLRRMNELALKLPEDILAERTRENIETVRATDAFSSEIRARVASFPVLSNTLAQSRTHGRDYLERASGETEEVLLFAPVPPK